MIVSGLATSEDCRIRRRTRRRSERPSLVARRGDYIDVMERVALPASDERRLLARARSGDRDAFGLLVAPYRRALHVHCYRMLGSLQEAEDLLQESLLRAWRGLGGFEARASVRGWLYRIATNACLDALKARKRRLLPDAYAAPDEPTAPPAPAVYDVPWIEPSPDELLPAPNGDPAQLYEAREAIALTFISALQFLSPRERAVLILRDALGYSARETAAVLESSLASVNSALARARASLARHPGGNLPAAVAPDEAAVVARYVEAWEAADVEGLVALLRDDARMTMPPTPSWYDGRAAVGAFFATFLESELGHGSRVLPMRANGQPALAVHARVGDDGLSHPIGIKVLGLRADGKIGAIFGFTDPALFPLFGLVPLSAAATQAGKPVPIPSYGS
jgi:RNA polymerase sigma-70 factor (ECF subfamily)